MSMTLGSTVVPRKIAFIADRMGGLNVGSRCGLEIQGRLPRAGRRNFLPRQ